MIDNLTFLNAELMWPLSIGAILLWCVFIWKEWYSNKKPRFWIKVTISFLAIGALVILVLKPVISVPGDATKMVILTEGYDQVRLDSIKKVHKRIKVYKYNINQLIFKDINIPDSVFILGYGVEPFDFWQFDNCKVKYLNDSIPSGVIRFTYDHKNTVGKQMIFNGLYHKPKKENQLVLEGPGGVYLDSVSLGDDEQQIFRLSTKLNLPGKFVFSLIEKDTTGKIHSKNPIPLLVEDPIPLKILIVNGFPTFETKYLKNYLAEMGHQVLVRSQITKGRYKYEYFNMERLPIGTFSEKNLQPFDLVIIDANSFKKLGKTSRAVLRNSIRENGLGLFIQSDQDFFRFSRNFGSFDFVTQKNVETNLKGQSKIKISKSPFFFKDEFLLHPIHKNTNNQVLSAYKPMGKGRIGTTVLENTYELVLNGRTKVYQELWSKLISSISNKEIPSAEWRSRGNIAYINQPFKFKLRTSIAKPMVNTINGYKISMREDIDISNLWSATTYPKTLGWDTLLIQQDTTEVFPYFVTHTSHWRSQTHYEKIVENNKYSAVSSKESKEENKAFRLVNPLGFFLIFLICIGYLWLEPKMVN
ncbi:hypothetical protein [Aquimarina algiphila]|uniref:hypothetical protein n=1 Tax=Aquimarina algiphila TaxID=2047982 RepID=UPI00232FBAFB|nr:hypothetical protein [Aquimarina algiphila]